jgi:hypothetical protein
MAMSKKKAEKAASSMLMSIFKPSDRCRTSAAKLASKSCDKTSKGTKKGCSTAGKVVGSKVANGKPGCKYYSKSRS